MLSLIAAVWSHIWPVGGAALVCCRVHCCLLASHLDEASGCQRVHEDVAPGVLHQQVGDEPHRGGVHLLQADAQRASERANTGSQIGSSFSHSSVLEVQIKYFFFFFFMTPFLTRSRRGRREAGRPAAAVT